MADATGAGVPPGPAPGRPFVTGYAAALTAHPGERLAVMAAADVSRRAEATLVRLGAGRSGGRDGEEVVRPLGTVTVGPQATQTGSFLVAPGGQQPWEPGPFVAAVRVSPSRLGSPQALLGQSAPDVAWSLGLDAAGRPVAHARGGTVSREVAAADALVEGAWYLVAAGFDPQAGLRLVVRPLPFTPSWRVAVDVTIRACEAALDEPLPIAGLLDAPFVVAARAVPAVTVGSAGAPMAAPDDPSGRSAPAPYARYRDCFDGRLELPQVLSGGLDDELVSALVDGGQGGGGRWADGSGGVDRCLAGWDFARRLTSGGVRGATVPGLGSAACDGLLWNAPAEAATASGWTGAEQDFRQAPAEYGAIHFHSDDLDDCRWSPTLEVALDDDLPSGAYAVRLDASAGGGAGEAGGEPLLADRIVFFVSASGRSPAAPLLFLAPTASYLAYANDHPATDGAFSEATASRTPVVYDDDLLLDEHREWGLSCYDSHADGSGVALSSARRPLVNMRPAHRYHVGPWQLPADLVLLDWLVDEGIAYDLATDEDLHREGAGLLAPYRAVLSGTHPEYYSTAMLDGLEEHLAAGGRLCHLGANGYYWRVAFDTERPWLMELRRGQSGSRAWESAPGEGHLGFSGERGGLWRHLGRPPQRLTGVGYAAQGFDRCGWFRRQPDSYDERVAFLFDGVDGDVFGTQGEIGGGAVGQELDRYDGRLGTPRDALLLATSEGLTEGYQHCVEEVLFTVPGTSARLDPDVRADVVYHVKPGGGAVFASGSIAWAGALRVDAGVARITRNLLDRFVDPAPLPW